MPNVIDKEGHLSAPVIVISDVHLGNKNSDYRAFRDFINWLNELGTDGYPVVCNGRTFKIRKPDTIVLLGDILELWDPRGDNRIYVIKDVLTPISHLGKLNCNIIYVIGNHDEDLREIKDIWEKGFEFPDGGKRTFEIYYRTFPERERINTDCIKGIKIGEKKYIFLHGHQFDRKQYFYHASRRLEKILYKLTKKEWPIRIDPIDDLQDLANVSFVKNIGINKSSATIVFIINLFIYIIIYFKYRVLDLDNVSDNILYILNLIWIIVSAYLIVTIIPKVVMYISTEIWRKLTLIQKCTSVEDVVNNSYDPKRGKLMDADILVFGHTHNAGEYSKYERTFVNTGCWVKDCEEEKQNTFLYIDETGHYLLKWKNIVKYSVTCV